ncbi:BatD family protein [Motiliproteus sediminis]|uniref:BatD family protein n=1 Tax=Motiliproteus sediminis TaxID=1468178 RepID=UPI001AEF8793|nr:BatD family protein [Motiliproteus sediminis]
MVTALQPVRDWLLPALLILLNTLVAVTAQAASLSASVDRNQLALDETLTLTLRYDSRDISGQPDLSPLEPFFDILGQSQSRQLRIINGQSESFTQWQISLAPKMEGRILVPAFELGGARSQPFEVQVRAPAVSPNRAGGDTFMERIVEPESAYPGQQLRVRIRLNTAVGLSDLQLTPLEVDGAKLLQLEDRQYQRSVNGRPYLVYEKNYALFPQQEGPLTLPAQALTAVKGASRSLFDRNPGQRVRLHQQPQTIEIQPAPVSSDWLPAEALRLEQSVIGNGTARVGEPVTLQLKLVAEGADPARLPLLTPPDLANVKVYPEPAEDDQQLSANGVITVRSQRFALVPTQPGTLTLPALRQRWWNSQRQQFETAESLALELEVQPGTGQANNATAPVAPSRAPATSVAEVAQMTKTAPAAAPVSTTSSPPQQQSSQAGWWLWSQLIWALLCGVLGWGWWRARQRQPLPSPQPSAETSPQADSHATEQQLRAACSAQDPAAVRQAIRAYAQATRLVPAPVTLTALMALAAGELRTQLERLDQALYAPDAAPAVNYEALLQQLLKLTPRATAATKADTLQPLYR